MKYKKMVLVCMLLQGMAGLRVQASAQSYPGANGKVAFSSNQNSSKLEIYQANADGTGVVQLTNNVGGSGQDSVGAVYSPTGDRVLFYNSNNLWVMNIDGSGLAQLATGGPAYPSASWSPDGLSIVYADSTYGDGDIWIYDLYSNGERNLTSDTASDLLPSWSPLGNKIAFTSDRDGDNEIYVMNVDGSSITKLTNNVYDDNYASWSPDGSKLTFASNRDGNFEVYSMSSDGSSQTRLTNNSTLDADPAWSPDGSQIIFTSNRVVDACTGGCDEIYTMNTNGTGVVRVSSATATVDNGVATWQPSGVNPLTYRLANYITKERLFTLNPAEVNTIKNTNGWVYEQVAFHAGTSTALGAQQVYRLANYITKERLFTLDTNEKDSINGRNGWVYEQVAFYAVPSSTPGSQPLYRLANYLTKERLFTLSAFERDSINGHNGWVSEGTAFYVPGS